MQQLTPYHALPKEVRPRKKILKDENTEIFHYLQTSLTKANIAGLSLSNFSSLEKTRKSLSLLYLVFICETYILSQLCQF